MKLFRAFSCSLLSALAPSLFAVAGVPVAPRYSLASVADEGTELNEQKAARIREVAHCLFQESPSGISSELEYSLYQWWSGASSSIPSENIQARIRTGGQSFNIVVDNTNHPKFPPRMEITIDEQVKLVDSGLDGRVNYGRDEATSRVFDERDYDHDGKESAGLEHQGSFQEKYWTAIGQLAAWCELRKAVGHTITPLPTSSVFHYPLISVADKGLPANPLNAAQARTLAEDVTHKWLPLSDSDFYSYHHQRENSRGYQHTSVFFRENNLMVKIAINNERGRGLDALTIIVEDKQTKQLSKFSDIGLDGQCDFGYEELGVPKKVFGRKQRKGLEHRDYFQKLYEHSLERLLQYYEGDKEKR